ncbi:MAG: tetratricopeptide repeat protein [Eubacteriales bacterium]
MKKIIFFLMAITITIIFQSNNVQADTNTSTFYGLYLIDGQDIRLNHVDIDISVESMSTNKIISAYEITNTGKETQYINLGTPIAETKMSNIKFSFTPYSYNSMVVNGKEINPKIEELDVDFANWQTPKFQVPIKAGETKTAQISYTVENRNTLGGKVTVLLNMDHLKTWGESPESFLVQSHFNPHSVEIYNFDNNFNVKPTEITPEYAYKWEISGQKEIKNIDFSYYFVDDAIIQQLQRINSDTIDKMITAYREKDYDDVINLGKQYIKNSKSTDNQNKVYLFMVNAYMEKKQYPEALAVYDLIEINLDDFEEIGDKIKEKSLYNKVICYLELKDYDKMYNLIKYELNYSDLNTYMDQWLEKQISLIPERELKKIEESYKEPSQVEKFLSTFVKGEISLKLIIALVAVFIIILIIIYIIRRRRKNKYFF